jgi:hypothetical protein
MIKFNINEYVFVQLTDAGRSELKRQHGELRETFPKMDDYTAREEDEDGWSKWQLWVLMNTFGHMTRMASEPAFKTTIKIVVE